MLTAGDAAALAVTINGEEARPLGSAGPGRHGSRHPDQLQGVPGSPVSRPTPLLDFFKRGEVARDVRMQAAEGALAPTAHEQIEILLLLARTATRRSARPPRPRSAGFRSTRSGRSSRGPTSRTASREFFAARGVLAGGAAPSESDDPLIDTAPARSATTPEIPGGTGRRRRPGEHLAADRQDGVLPTAESGGQGLARDARHPHPRPEQDDLGLGVEQPEADRERDRGLRADGQRLGGRAPDHRQPTAAG